MNDVKAGLVWIIDDDEIIRYLSEMMFKQTEFCEQSVFFNRAEDALAKLGSAANGGMTLPDLIMLDLSMPGMDGWTFLEEIHHLSLPESVPVFIFTSSINEHEIIRVKSYPLVKDVITKPLTVHKINKILRQV